MSINTFSKRIITGLSQWTGTNWFLRYHNRQQLLVLCYHGVVSEVDYFDPYLYRNAIQLSDFVEQLRIIRRSFHPISGRELVDAVSTDSRLPDNSVLVTFDDGFRNNLTVAAPALKDLKIPAIVHVTTDSIDSGRPIWPVELDLLVLNYPELEPLPLPDGSKIDSLATDQSARIKVASEIRTHCKRLPNKSRDEYMTLIRRHQQPLGDQHKELLEFMNWDEVQELSQMGFEIGSHTLSHPILANIEVAEISNELKGSKEKIETVTGKPCEWLAYPNGTKEDYTDVVLEKASKLGFKIGFTLAQRMCNLKTDGRFEIPRLCIDSGMTSLDFRARISGFFDLAKRLRTGKKKQIRE